MKLLQKLSALTLSSERAEFLQQVGRWVGDTMRLKVASTCPRHRQMQESASPPLEADCVCLTACGLLAALQHTSTSPPRNARLPVSIPSFLLSSSRISLS